MGCSRFYLPVFLFQVIGLCAVVQAGVSAAWHFDEGAGATAADAVGSVNGALLGDAAFTPGGVSGGAVSMTRPGGGFVDMGNDFGL